METIDESNEENNIEEGLFHEYKFVDHTILPTIKDENQGNMIYVTSEISKQFFSETQSGATFLPPDEIVPSFDNCVVNARNNPTDDYSITITLKLVLFKFCPLCGLPRENMNKVQEHLENCVGKENYKIREQKDKKEKLTYVCGGCEKQFTSQKLFTKHRYFCDPSVLLADHAISEQLHGNTEFKDSKDVNFPEPNNPPKSQKKSSHTCNICKKTFSIPSYLKNHMRIHTGEKPHVCQQCGRGFADKSSLRNHLKVHTDERPFQCELCPKKFRRSDNLKYHMASHNPKNRPFICSHCAKSFKNQRDLRAHEKTIHTVPTGVNSEEKELHDCQECDMSFESLSSLNCHMKVIHGKGKSFKCDFCGKNCIAQSQLDIHMRSHTGERPFKCPTCDKSFRRHSHLYMHVQRHTGDSEFKCTQCDKSFPQKVELKQHEKLHTGLKPYECGLCGKCFAREDYVKIHMKTHGAAPNLLPNLDTKVGGILPLSVKKDADTGNTKHVYVVEPHVPGKETGNGNTKHVYVMEPDVPGGSSGSQLRQVGVAHEGVAATIVIPAPGAVEVDLAREVYLYR